MMQISTQSVLNNEGNIFLYTGEHINEITEYKSFLYKNNYSKDSKIEFLSKDFFSSKISLKHNLDFICSLNNVDLKNFLVSNNLENIFCEYKNLKKTSIPVDIFNLVMLHLYLHTNSSYLIAQNLAPLIKSFDDQVLVKVKNYFLENKLIYFANSMQRIVIREDIFRYFLVMYDKNNHEIFDNFADFEKALQN
tara:strand:+ start:108 stop:686 length:579 start_codon:yes stop_codon:yes gene_type:complete